MTNEELKTALLTQVPVMHDGIEYKCVSGILYRKNPEGGIRIEAELMDRCRHSVSIVYPESVRFVESGKGEKT